LAQKTLEIFFTGKHFKIPNYQRDYSWEIPNIDELFDDILEAMDTKVSHYIGTFILSEQNGNSGYYDVVDGQQRLTTLTMILNAVIETLTSEKEKIINEDKFIKSDLGWKLELLGKNSDFFKDLLDGKSVDHTNKSQRLLKEAYNHIKSRVHGIKDEKKESVFLAFVKDLEIMEFVESDAGKAIRIFQTVNDRGKPLSNVDKAKSLLIYYSNRLLTGNYDDTINDCFGKMYQCFNEIKEIGEDTGISLLSQRTFTEDSIMRYHFIAYPNDLYDYNATANYVLDVFLKNTLKSKKSDLNELDAFIHDYVTDLSEFFVSMLDIVRKVKQSERYYKLFSILGISTLLYPLTIRLQMQGILEKVVWNNKHSFLDLIEIADVRVYKTRGTDPTKDISYLACNARSYSESDIKKGLVTFIKSFMSLTEFKSRLEGDIYGNAALKYVFFEYDEDILKNKGGNPYSIQDLIKLNNTVPTIEHIFAQEVRFNFPGRGFNTDVEYFSTVHRLGNLTLLEKSLNSRGLNKTPEQKVIDQIYSGSKFETTQKLNSKIQNNGNNFEKQDIEKRSAELVDFCVERWKI
jgi:hypothetical protein